MTTLKIGYFYPDLLNLYGDNGNVEILSYRANAYGFDVEILKINLEPVSFVKLENINLVFMGGGPDSSQKSLYEDLIKNKKAFFQDYIEAAKIGMYICGSYQLFGKYYKSADGTILEGLDLFDLYTEHFGKSKPRCIGNTSSALNTSVFTDPLFPKTVLKDSLVGFENHGGRTYLGPKSESLAKVVKGYGNNGEDGEEGMLYKKSLGTYYHGPFLSRNPHVADWLIFSALGLTPEQISKLPKINDTLAIQAHTASRQLRQ